MQNEEASPNLADEIPDMSTDGAVNANTELRKRRSTRIVQAVPLVVTGVDALGRPFAERTSTLIINCHGCRYQSKHYVLKNMWVNLEVPHPDPGKSPRRVRGKVAWIQRPRTVRQLFQVALELDTPGNVWGIAFPPDDWFSFPEEGPFFPNAVAPADLTGATLPPGPGEAAIESLESDSGLAAPDNLRVFPAPGSATDASMQLARQVARLLAEAKQQIQAAARDAAVEAVAAERRRATEQWEQKYLAFRDEVARERAHAVGSIQEESQTQARAAQAAAAETWKNELPRWLAPQLEQLTHELTAQLAKEGAVQRDQHEKQLSSAQEMLQTLCSQVEEAGSKLRKQAETVESEVTAHLEEAALRTEQEAERKRMESAGQANEALSRAGDAARHVLALQEEGRNTLREQLAQEVEAAQARWQNEVESVLKAVKDHATGELKEHVEELQEELEEKGEKQVQSLKHTFESQVKQLEETLSFASATTEKLRQHAVRFETVQQQAVSGFQSQLDDVLSLHRNELHRRSVTLFEEIHARIRQSFEVANSEALEKFERQVQQMVAPHVTQAEQAIQRLAGGRSLLDAAMTMQQDRIRAAADEAFADSLGRFRENLGSVEQVLNESAQAITARNLEDLESKSADLKHQVVEEMFKTAAWYEKKAQTQLQGITEKSVEQAANELREKAREVSGLLANETGKMSRSYAAQSRQQMEEAVQGAFERIRVLFAEAADTTSAAFTDEIQRNARKELEGFAELVRKGVEESSQRLDSARTEVNQKLTMEQEEFLLRFQAAMSDAVNQGMTEAQEKTQEGFAALRETWRKMNEDNLADIRGAIGKIQDESAEQYRGRLENISNSWMVATVTTLDHQSREAITKIAATAEDKLREASAEVFARFGDTLRERLQQIAAGFDKPGPLNS
jgi:hypothetical protein